MGHTMEAHEIATMCGVFAEEKKAQDVVIMKLADLTDIADFFVLASGTSERHVRTIADSVETGMKGQGIKPYSLEGYKDGRWIIIDYQNIIVHVFFESLRELYDLESLWIEAKRYRIENEKKYTEVDNEKTRT
ncbi:MAG: ribosome silencing factor [Syntrophus sp. (in: bacteria)]|nr:ribosome silencing factor [Syntrophus sp. (in: bacteria)]